jgi:hypothetical protein
VFGLNDKAATRGASRGRSKGVVLVRTPRRISWLAGWTTAPGAAGPADGSATKPATNPGPPAPARRQT